jgi:hypothetical protein
MSGRPPLTSVPTYADLVRLGREAVSLESRGAWAAGDVAGTMATQYGDETLARFARDIGTEYATLRVQRWVAAQFPEKVRHPTFSWSVHQTLAGQPDRLELLASRPDWTVKSARALVASRKPKPDRPERKLTTVESVVDEVISDLGEIADAEFSDLGQRLAFVADHRDKLSEEQASRLVKALAEAEARVAAWHDRLTAGGGERR